jgi:hypothetical protein
MLPAAQSYEGRRVPSWRALFEDLKKDSNAVLVLP